MKNNNADLPLLDTELNDSNEARSLGIRARLLIGFIAVTSIFLIAIIISFITLTTTKRFANDVISHDFPLYNAFLDLGGQLYLAESSLKGYILTSDNAQKTEFFDAWLNIDKRVNEINNTISATTDVDVFKNWQTVVPVISDLKLQQQKIINSYIKTNSAEMANLLVTTVNPVTNKIFDVIDGPVNANGERVGGIYDVLYADLQQKNLSIIRDMTFTQVTESVLSLIAVFITVFISLFTAKGILRHINLLRQYSSRVAAGDLRQQVKVQSRDEIGLLSRDFNIMIEALAGTTKQITEACHNMVSSLDEVKHAVDIQSSGATEQASSINEITASIGEIEKSSNQTMEKAKSLGEAAERTREKGQQGLEAVEQSVLGMKSVREKVQLIAQTILDLSNQTQQVGEITAVVNTLAQQSKMLALNASIEAAKAGDAGKGFAVVATEVKNLAEQSEQATTQVQKILEDIRHAAEKAVMVTEEGTKGVDYGTNLVEQTGEVVRNLSDVIHETTIATQQIEAAIRQESVGIEQITAGMNEINQVTSSFVESAKQTTEAINNLSAIAKSLKERVDTYKV